MFSRGGKMRPQLAAILVILAAVSTALAGAPDGQPLIPIDQIPVPGPRSTVAPADSTPSIATGNIVILPFEVLGDSQHLDWVPQAVQQSIAAEVARLNGLFPITTAAIPAASDTA